MATAPTPGIGRREAAADSAQVTLAITVCGETRHLAPNNLTFEERAAVRKATGFPFAVYWGGEQQVDMDSVQVLWWLARRASGEPTLPLPDVLAAWPATIGPDDLNLEVVDDGDDPEVSAPV